MTPSMYCLYWSDQDTVLSGQGGKEEEPKELLEMLNNWSGTSTAGELAQLR